MELRESQSTQPKLMGVHGAARYYGVSIKTFRDHFMPHIPTVFASSPDAKRQRRLFSVDALDSTLVKLQKTAA